MERDKINTQIAKTIEEIMGISLQSISHTAKLNSIPARDSFNNLMLISKLQEEFHVEFTAKDIEETQTIEQIFALVKRSLTHTKK